MDITMGLLLERPKDLLHVCDIAHAKLEWWALDAVKFMGPTVSICNYMQQKNTYGYVWTFVYM